MKGVILAIAWPAHAALWYGLLDPETTGGRWIVFGIATALAALNAYTFERDLRNWLKRERV